MKLGQLICFCLVFFISACCAQPIPMLQQKSGEQKLEHRNRLGEEKSPYLLQHKDNPVHWFAWGDEAFARAKKEDKPIFLSIGYSTCHWCHVMEHDSFETTAVARVLNENFISIKVDREERPDVDQIYMSAVVQMTGRGGWPMSVFLTPEREPFYGATFFWQAQFLQILGSINQGWREERDQIMRAAQTMVAALQKPASVGPSLALTESIFTKVLQQFETNFDELHGGFGSAPKFPRSIDLSLLMRIAHRSGNTKALAMVQKTLDEMAFGGIYDQLGGGFHRYSTDSHWLTPHFEKMLYDNALLALTYLEAYQLTQKEMYAAVGREILDYVLRDMTQSQGGFYSAEDADSEGEEGKFYVWTEKELKSHLTPDEFNLLQKTLSITGAGNFENGTNILHWNSAMDWKERRSPLFQSIRKKLLVVRAGRVHPYKDDKVLTDWNGLMIQAMSKGYRVLGDERYLQAGQAAASFIKDKLDEGGILQRRYRDGEARFAGTLDDFAHLIGGLIALYEADFNPAWLKWAEDLQKRQDQLFWDTAGSGYFFSAVGTSDLFIRNKELHDGATPSGSAVSALNLLKLHALTWNQDYHARAEKLFAVLSTPMERYPAGFAMGLVALDYYLDQSKEVAVVTSYDDAAKILQTFLNQNFLPNISVAVGPAGSEYPALLKDRPMQENKTTVYVCEQQLCQQPTTDMPQAIKLIRTYTPLF